MEDAYLVPAILWLVQTILGTLGIRELDSWIRQAGLQDHIENLKSELEVVRAVASDAKGRTLRSARLDKSLADLKKFLYDTDDAVDELDYWRLRHQVKEVAHTVSISQDPLPSSNPYNQYASDGVTQPCTAATTTTAVTLQEPEGMNESARVDDGTSRGNDNILPRSGRGKKRSKAWDDFEDIKDDNGKTVHAECRHCKKRVQYKGAQGTRVLITHVNSAECKNTREARPQPPSHSSIDAAAENAIPVAASNLPSRPRMETNQESTQITAAITHPWSKDEISSRIREITRQLQGIRGDVTKDLSMLGSDSGASSGHHQSTASDPRRRTSSLLQGKVYGRDEKKNSIVKFTTARKSDSVTVVPIVGIGGIGKTALAQFVYNDPKVQNQFDHSIWVWVSNSFDEMRITREMLDIVPREKHEGLCSLDKLQRVLKTHIESKRVLIILDDVWDDMNNCRLDLILAPFKSNNANGNVILVTTRYLSVAKRIGMTEPVVLGGLEVDDLWLLLKARAFGDENYEGHGNLTSIGWKIARKLKGNPLAAVTAGELLRVDLTLDHWNKILEDEDWKLLGLSGGIMSSLKLSYDQLPYHLHQCFSYCSIFPDSYKFLGEELVCIWISQGFVKQSHHPSKKLEEIGMDYLADLVNLGYFQQVERKDSSLHSQNSFSFEGSNFFYVVSGLMHDFARMASRADCAIIDGLQCNDILPTVQHLSIECKKNQHGNVPWSSKFKDDLRKTVTSVRKLRTLLLVEKYDCPLQSFEDIFQKAHDIRLLQISATFEDFSSLVRSSINPTHLRYLKLTVNELRGDLPQVLSNFCHLQVLDVGSDTHLDVPRGMNNLVSLRHLVAASIARIGKLTSLQTLSNFRVQDSNGFQIIELQSMNELVQLRISHLENVKTPEEACGAGLRYKRHLENLHLSWNMSVDEYDSDDSDECEEVTSSEYDSDGSDECEEVTSSEPFTSTETMEYSPAEVLEGLRPYNNLKYLQISGYNGATSPSWLASNTSVTSLQTLYLENCRKWLILPSLQRLPLLRKLKLSGMPNVVKISVPSLEELVLVKMKKLETCSCTSMRELNSCLRVLKIKNCTALKLFDLFGDGHKFKTEKKSWLPRIWELVIHNCPLLLVPHPLPSSSTISRISTSRVSEFPRIDSRSCGSLTIGMDPKVYISDDEYDSDESDNLSVLDGNILAFHNPRFLTKLIIGRCRNLMSISFKGLSELVSLKTLRIIDCPGLSGFDVPPEHTPEDLTAANCNALQCLVYLQIDSCGIAWQWLSLILQHAPALTRLDLHSCPKLGYLQLNSCTALEKLKVCACESLGTLDVLQSRSLAKMKVEKVPNLKSLQLHSCTTLQKLVIDRAAVCMLEGVQSLKKLDVCRNQHLKSLQLHSCTALEELNILSCPGLSSLDVPPEHTHEDLTAANCNALPSLDHLRIDSCGIAWEWLSLVLQHALTALDLFHCPELESLQLCFCTALEKLDIQNCTSLSTLEGFQSLGSLGRLYLRECPGLHSCLEGLPVQDYKLCPRLEFIEISDFSFLTTSICTQLTSLQRLVINGSVKETPARLNR